MLKGCKKIVHVINKTIFTEIEQTKNNRKLLFKKSNI